MTPADLDCVAFVIIGRNEGPRLGDCLTSALNVSTKVVYADSGSSDGSADLAKSLGAYVVELDTSGPMNAARGRNAGLEAVRRLFPECRYVQFIDGDCVLQLGWTERAVAFLQEHRIAAVACGRRFEAHPDASLYNRLADEEWDTPVGPCSSCGGDAMMRIAALDQAGAFDPSLMASEEPELAARLRHAGWQIWRLDVPMTEHDARIYTLRQWWRRTTRSGYGYAQAWVATRGSGERVNERLLRSALLWTVLLPAVIFLLCLLAESVAPLLLLPLMYGAQILRMTARTGKFHLDGVKANAMLVLAKVPELIGAARYFLNIKRTLIAIEYKTHVTQPQVPE